MTGFGGPLCSGHIAWETTSSIWYLTEAFENTFDRFQEPDKFAIRKITTTSLLPTLPMLVSSFHKSTGFYRKIHPSYITPLCSRWWCAGPLTCDFCSRKGPFRLPAILWNLVICWPRLVFWGDEMSYPLVYWEWFHKPNFRIPNMNQVGMHGSCHCSMPNTQASTKPIGFMGNGMFTYMSGGWFDRSVGKYW